MRKSLDEAVNSSFNPLKMLHLSNMENFILFAGVSATTYNFCHLNSLISLIVSKRCAKAHRTVLPSVGPSDERQSRVTNHPQGSLPQAQPGETPPSRGSAEPRHLPITNETEEFIPFLHISD